MRDDGLVVGWQVQPDAPSPDCVDTLGWKDPYAWPGGLIENEALGGMRTIKINANDEILLAEELLTAPVAYIAASPDDPPLRLHDLIPPNPWVILSPGDINNHGEIVGHLHDSTLATIPYIAWPCPSPILPLG